MMRNSKSEATRLSPRDVETRDRFSCAVARPVPEIRGSLVANGCSLIGQGVGHCRLRGRMLLALTAPAPVPTATTKQEHNHDDNQNHFGTHLKFSES